MHTPDEGSPYSSNAPASLPAAASTEPALKRNTLGIAALVLAGVAILLQGASIVLAVVQHLHGTGKGENDQLLIGLMFCAGGLLTLPGLGLGIAGLFQTDRGKGLALAGVALNATLLLLVIGMVALGLSQRS